MIFFNELDILTYIQNDDSFQSTIFEQLGASEAGSDKRRQILGLLQDILTLSKNITSGNRIELFRNLKAHGLFEHFHITLDDPNVASRLATAEIIGMTLVQDPSLLRSFLLTQRPPLLLPALLNHFISDEDAGLMILICDILKALCDINTITDPRDKEEFTDYIYEYILPHAVKPILSSSSLVADVGNNASKGVKLPGKAVKFSPHSNFTDEDDDESGKSRFVMGSARSDSDKQTFKMELTEPKYNNDTLIVDICELLCFCLARHGNRIRSLLTTTWLLSRVTVLLNGSYSCHVCLAALRLLRTIVGVRDEQLDLFVVKANLLQPAMDLFTKNMVHNNMLNSAVLEMVDFMRRKNIVVLITYLAETFGPRIEQLRVSYPTFDKLMERYRQNKEHETTMFSFIS